MSIWLVREMFISSESRNSPVEEVVTSVFAWLHPRWYQRRKQDTGYEFALVSVIAALIISIDLSLRSFVALIVSSVIYQRNKTSDMHKHF